MTKPQKEALKEIGRWVACSLASWIITQVIDQIVVIPLVHQIRVWEFNFIIPVQRPIQAGLTLALRGLDKYKFELSKILSEKIGDKELRKGILPF